MPESLGNSRREVVVYSMFADLIRTETHLSNARLSGYRAVLDQAMPAAGIVVVEYAPPPLPEGIPESEDFLLVRQKQSVKNLAADVFNVTFDGSTHTAETAASQTKDMIRTDLEDWTISEDKAEDLWRLAETSYRTEPRAGYLEMTKRLFVKIRTVKISMFLAFALQANSLHADVPHTYSSGKLAFGTFEGSLEHTGKGITVRTGTQMIDVSPNGRISFWLDQILIFDGVYVVFQRPVDRWVPQHVFDLMSWLEALTEVPGMSEASDRHRTISEIHLDLGARELMARIRQDGAEIICLSRQECSLPETVQRLAVDYAHAEVRLMERSDALAIGFGAPYPLQPAVLGFTSDERAKLRYAPSEGAAQIGIALGSFVATTDKISGEPGQRFGCVPLFSCGWVRIEDLREVRPEWIETDKASGRINRVFMSALGSNMEP